MATEPTDAPPRKTKAERWADIHRLAMQRFDDIWSAEHLVRKQAMVDRTFSTLRGGMWAGQFAVGSDAVDDKGEPIDSGAPRLEVPKVAKALNRIFSEYRANRVTVDFKPKDEDSNSRDADNLDGLFRADMNDTDGGGQDAFDTAYDEGTNGGMGAWRLRARYEDDEDEDNEHQRIDLLPIYDADRTVFFDRTAKNYTKSDARFAFVLFAMTREAFEDQYPDATPSTFTTPLEWNYEWITPDDIWLAEYYVVDDHSVLRRTFKNLGTAEERTEDDATLTAERDDGTKLEDELTQTGWEQVRQRRIKRQRVRKYLLTGAEVLEDEGVIAGRHIPVVPFYAKRWFLNGTEWFKGHTRDSIDASRLYNMIVSGLAEAASGPADDTPILLPEQVVGYEDVWAGRRVNRPAFLPLNPILDAEGNIIKSDPVGSIPVAQVQPNMAALLQVSASDIAELTGEADQVETVPANTSDEAIQLVHDRSDMRTFIYKDNFRKSMEWCGIIYQGMAADLYVEDDREMIAIGPDGKKSRVRLNQKAMDSDGGEYRKNDFTTGNYDVIVDVGPASKTRKEATRKVMENVATVAATIGANDLARAALGVAVINTEGEGLEGIQAMERRAGIAAGYVEPTQQEAAEIQAAKEQQGQQQDPNLILAQAQVEIAKAETLKAQASLAEAETKRLTAEANADLARARTAEVLAKIDVTERAQILAEVDSSLREDDMTHRQAIDAVNTTTQVERHDRDMTKPEATNGDAA